MRKAERDILRIAKEAGIRRPRIVSGGQHARLIGECNGTEICVVVSLTKCLATKRNVRNTRLNMAKAVEETKSADLRKPKV